MISYTIDTWPGWFNLLTLNWNGWPTVAGSDYANPSANGLADYDFTPTYTGPQRDHYVPSYVRWI